MIANESFGEMTTPEQSHIGDNLRGIVLDLDGLPVDSELWSWQAHDAALQSYGHEPLSVDEVRRLIGLVRIDEWTELSKMRVLDVDRPEYDMRHRVAFVEARARNLAPLPGVLDLLDVVARLRLRLALASNSAMASITDTLAGLGIMTRFDVIASGQDVRRPKPAPDVYQLALERLELAPDEAIAVEDSRVGLTAAASAGLRCIAVPGPLTSSQDFSEAFLRFPSLVEVAAWLDEHVCQPA